MEKSPPTETIELGILLLTTNIAVKFKDIERIPKGCLSLLVDKKLIRDTESFVLTRLGARFLVQAEKDIYSHKW